MKRSGLSRAFVAIAMMLIGWLPSLAYDFEVDGIYYIKNDNNTVYVTYQKYYSGGIYSSDYLGNVVIPSLVNYGGVTYSVTRIGNHAFDGCSSLISIEIPNSVTSIGDDAFYWCTSLTSIEIPNSVTSIGDWAFYGCSSLTSIQIPDNVIRIGSYAFYKCSNLTSIVIPNSLLIIRNNAFEDTRLTKITCMATTPPVIESSTFSKYSADLYVPAGCKSAYESAEYWKNFNNIIELEPELEEGIAFEYGGLTYKVTVKGKELAVIASESGEYSGAVVIPSSVNYNGITYSVTSIGVAAFSDCESLTSIEIPNSVTSIGDDAFFGCSSLTSIEIPDNVTSIGWYTFSGCKSLTSIVVDSGNTKYDSRNGCNAIIETASNTLIAGCQNTIIPNSVTSIGYAAFFGCSSLTSIKITNSVTSIGGGAFIYCESLTSIEIPNSVTSIGEFSFSGCKSLTSIVVDSGNTKYDSRNGCNAIIETASNTLIAGCQNTIIPNSVTSIGEGAFRDCDSLASIQIPNSVTSIGDWAFRDCTNLTSIEIPNSVTSIGDSAFYLCSSLTSIEIPNSVTSIGDRAFYLCSSLTKITCLATTPPTIESYTFSNYSVELYVPAGCISAYQSANYWKNFSNIIELEPELEVGMAFEYGGLTYKVTVKGKELAVIASESGEYSGAVVIPSSADYNGITYSVTSIGDGAFEWCTSLTSIEIPNSVTSIGDLAFDYCDRMTNIEIPNSATSIGDYAFAYCSNLTSIEIPNSVTSIGEGAFLGCSRLTSIIVVARNPKYDSRNGCNAIIETASNTLIAGCQNTIILDSVTSIGDWAFCECSNLTSIEIPNSVTSIGECAFAYCSSLTSIQIPDSVTSIGDWALYYCESLTSIEIPNSATSIGDWAFYGCDRLTKITCLATTPPTIESSTFSKYSAELYVPAGCISAYQSANYWKNFSNIIEIPEEISFGLAGHTSAISCNPQDDYSFGISWREFAEILYNDYIPFSSVEDFKNVYDTSNLKVIYSYNGRDITQYVGASFDASLNPDNIYAWSFTFYDNIPAEVFPLNVNDATNLDIQVLCTPKQDKESYPILRVNTNLTIEPLGEYLSTMVNLNEAYWLDATTLRILPIQYGSLDAGMTCDYRFPILNAFMRKPAVCNDKLDCVTWDVVFSNQQSAGYAAANYNLFFNNQIGAQLEWDSSSDNHTRFDELCGVADNHEVFVLVYNNAAGKEIIDANQPVQITFLSRYPNGQVVPVESYNLQFVKPLNFRTAEFNGYFIDGAYEGQDGYAINTADPFIIRDFRNQPVTKASNNGLYDYYGLEEVVWHVEEARVGITSDGVVLSKDKMLTIDGEINTAVTTIIGQATTADMSLVHNGSQLIYKNTGTLNVEKDFYIALYVSVKHKWGEFKAPVIIPVKVVRNINNITLDKSEAYLIVDEQISLKATVLPENATNKSVTWKSSNEAVAIVDANGTVTAVGVGEAIITATTDGTNLSASCKVTVYEEASANFLSGKTINTYSGASERVSVEMTNEQAITAFQCDIYLPDGISIATIDGEYDINLSSRAKSSHSLSCVEQSDGSIRLLCYSMSLATFSGNEGELFDINFDISNEIEGNYQVLINNVVLTDKAQNEYKSSAAIIDFNVKAYTLADVNNDGSINVTDVVATASYILGLDTKKFIFEAADINKDGVINVTDIVGIASIILNGGSASSVSVQRCAPNTSDVIKIEDFAAGKNQSQQVAIEMTNASDYSAFQMDIRLPKGMSIAECELASVETDHMVAYRELPDGAVRVLVYSLTCQTLQNSEEGIIRLRTTTDKQFEGGEIVVENILFADRGQNEYRLYDSVANVNLATGVSATDMDCVVYAENQSIVIISPCDQQATITSVDGVSRTYSLNEGRNEIVAPQAGVYIVTIADETFKVMVK